MNLDEMYPAKYLRGQDMTAPILIVITGIGKDSTIDRATLVVDGFARRLRRGVDFRQRRVVDLEIKLQAMFRRLLNRGLRDRRQRIQKQCSGGNCAGTSMA